jgi:hypothetical protein
MLIFLTFGRLSLDGKSIVLLRSIDIDLMQSQESSTDDIVIFKIVSRLIFHQ